MYLPRAEGVGCRVEGVGRWQGTAVTLSLRRLNRDPNTQVLEGVGCRGES
jgi:hypothetical protein